MPGLLNNSNYFFRCNANFLFVQEIKKWRTDDKNKKRIMKLLRFTGLIGGCG